MELSSLSLTDVEMSRVLYISDRLSEFLPNLGLPDHSGRAGGVVVPYILFKLTFGGMRRRNQHRTCVPATVTPTTSAAAEDNA